MATALLRLKRREDFLRVAASRRRWVTPAFILQARERREPPEGAAPAVPARVPGSILAGSTGPGLTGEVRVGFTVSRKVGNAVVRNRVRRRLRAAAAEVLPMGAAPGFDLVLVGRTGALTYPYPRLLQDLTVALDKLGVGKGGAEKVGAAARPDARP
jgi:ribonuclease P protein component